MTYSCHQALQVIRAISHQLLHVDPGLLTQTGIWRTNGTKATATTIVEKVLHDQGTIHGYESYEYSDAIKLALKDLCLIPQSADCHRKLKRILFSMEEPGNPVELTSKFFDLIKSMVATKDIEIMHSAEILHSLVHLGYITTQYASTNKMPPYNVAATLLGPVLINNIDFDLEPEALISFSSMVISFMSHILSYEDIQEGQSQNPFAKPFIYYFATTSLASRNREISMLDELALAIERMELAQTSNVIKLRQGMVRHQSSLEIMDQHLEGLEARRVERDITKQEYKILKARVDGEKSDTAQAASFLDKQRHEICEQRRQVKVRKEAVDAQRVDLRSSQDFWVDTILHAGPEDIAEMALEPPKTRRRSLK